MERAYVPIYIQKTPEQQAELDENFAKYWSNSQGSWKNLFRLLREFRAEMQEAKHHD